MTCRRVSPSPTQSEFGLTVAATVASRSSCARSWSKYATLSLRAQAHLAARRAPGVPRISCSSVVLPAPFGPIRPMRSPRMTRRSSVADDRRGRRNALLTLRSSATSLPERSPASTLSRTLPSRSRRASRWRRSCSSRCTRPSLRVRRASTPLRIQTSSCAQNLSNLRLSTASSASCSALRRSYAAKLPG